MSNVDKFLQKAEDGLDIAFRARVDAVPVCLAALSQAEPTNPNSAYGKKVIVNRLIRLGDRSADYFECMAPDCDVRISKTDLEVLSGSCNLLLACLKESWQQKAGGEGLERDGEYLGPGAFGCRNPLCDFTCGWSEDGIPGTDGTCLQEAPAN